MSEKISQSQVKSLVHGWAKACVRNGSVDQVTALSVISLNRSFDCPTTLKAADRFERVVKRLARQLG